MRKLLLASAAIAVMGAGPAMALDSDTITIQSTLAQACQVDIANTTAVMPANGSPSALEAFSFECNFGGEGATLSFASTFGGVSNGFTTHVYNIVPSTGAPGTSAVTFPNFPLIPLPNTPVNASFTVDLVNPILVAGTYSDTLTISITP